MNKLLVLQSDFGVVDGAVSAMIGVALSVDPEIKIYDLSHSITPFNIFEASYRLFQSIQYWPEGSVFVSVVDPGVGSNRTSVVALTNTNHIVVTPNNGTLSHLKKYVGLKEVYLIDVNKNRRKDVVNQSYTFDGRDLYAYIGARLSSKKIDLNDVGNKLNYADVIELELPISRYENNKVFGSVEIFDERYGSVWTSIIVDDFNQLKPTFGEMFNVVIRNEMDIKFNENIIFGRAFNDVPVSNLVIYINSLNRIGIAINQGSVSEIYNIKTGNDWIVEITKIIK